MFHPDSHAPPDRLAVQETGSSSSSSSSANAGGVHAPSPPHPPRDTLTPLVHEFVHEPSARGDPRSAYSASVPASGGHDLLHRSTSDDTSAPPQPARFGMVRPASRGLSVYDAHVDVSDVAHAFQNLDLRAGVLQPPSCSSAPQAALAHHAPASASSDRSHGPHVRDHQSHRVQRHAGAGGGGGGRHPHGRLAAPGSGMACADHASGGSAAASYGGGASAPIAYNCAPYAGADFDSPAPHRATPSSARAGGSRGSSTRRWRVFVTKLPQHASRDDITAYFVTFLQLRGHPASWRAVTDVYLAHTAAGHSRGFAFVSVCDQYTMEMIVAEQHIVCGKQVVVDVAVPRDASAGEAFATNPGASSGSQYAEYASFPGGLLAAPWPHAAYAAPPQYASAPRMHVPMASLRDGWRHPGGLGASTVAHASSAYASAPRGGRRGGGLPAHARRPQLSSHLHAGRGAMHASAQHAEFVHIEAWPPYAMGHVYDDSMMMQPSPIPLGSGDGCDTYTSVRMLDTPPPQGHPLALQGSPAIPGPHVYLPPASLASLPFTYNHASMASFWQSAGADSGGDTWSHLTHAGSGVMPPTRSADEAPHELPTVGRYDAAFAAQTPDVPQVGAAPAHVAPPPMTTGTTLGYDRSW